MEIRDCPEAIQQLQTALRRRSLTLYLGAGVSKGNGLPTWEELVQAMYFAEALPDEEEVRPRAGYLFAIARWHLSRSREPLEITARKLRQQYTDGASFRRALRRTLYYGFLRDWDDQFATLRREDVTGANKTLAAVARLCTASQPERGVSAVITYNYDSLLEKALPAGFSSALWKAGQSPRAGTLPIYHVHGFVPMRSAGSEAEEIVFTEDQYHREILNPYSWSNLVQLRLMANTTGLLVGLSVTDRNMRRLLEALRVLPEDQPQYALMQRPSWPAPDSADEARIYEDAQERIKHLVATIGPVPEVRPSSIARALQRVAEVDQRRQEQMLRDLGVVPIWYDQHDEIAAFVERVLTQLCERTG